jgi:hypothetical protein
MRKCAIHRVFNNCDSEKTKFGQLVKQILDLVQYKNEHKKLTAQFLN